MHIAFVNNTEKWGGVKTWTISMAASFLSAGHAVSVYGQDPVFIARARAMGLPALRHVPGPDWNPFSIWYYRKSFKERGVDVAVVNVGKDVRTAGMSAYLLNLPVIRRVGAPGDFRDTIKTRFEARLLRQSFMCCSNYVLENLKNNVPFVREYEGIAIHPGTPFPSALPQMPEGPLRLITTSRLSEDKKHIDLLGALALLRREGIMLPLDIVGDGPMRPALEAFTREHSLGDLVTFYGFTQDVASYLDKATVFVLPTREEPLGIALEEAMAHALVPIARNAGGVPEIWPDHITDLLVEKSGGPDAFAEKLRSVALWPRETFLDVRSKVFTKAQEMFSQEKQYNAFATWVQDVISTHALQGKAHNP